MKVAFLLDAGLSIPFTGNSTKSITDHILSGKDVHRDTNQLRACRNDEFDIWLAEVIVSH